MGLKPTLVLTVLLAVAGGAAVVLWSFPGTVDAQRARPGLRVGMTVNLQGYDRDGRLKAARLAARTGITMIRDDFDWSTVEPRPGIANWREGDAIVTAAARARLSVLPILGSTPRWAGRSSGAMPRDPAAYARFVAAAVARYGPGGYFWRLHPDLDARLAPVWFELYNEPYLSLDVPGGPRPAAYARTVAAAVPAGRAANPRARFLLAADTTWIDPDGEEHPWLAQLHAAVPDLRKRFDGVAAHPYASGEPPGRYTPGDGDRWQSRRIEALRNQLVGLGEGDKPVWVTEVGWSTCRWGPECVGKREQARYLADFFALASTRWRPWVAAVFVYTLEDFHPPSSKKETAFGVAGRGAEPKPAWDVLRQVTGVY